MRRIVLASTLLVTTAGSAAAQAVFTGRIINDSTRAAVGDVEILIEGTTARTLTDPRGRFVLPGLPAGLGTVMIRKIGYRPIRVRTLVFRLDTLDVEIRISPAVVELEPLVVQATAVPRGMDAFAERRFKGLGSFIDAAALRKSENRALADVLRGVSGVRIQPGRNGEQIAVGSRGTCPMAVWIDGVRASSPNRGFPLDLNQFSPNQLEGVEIYRGAADTPIELSNDNTACGTIVLWTRRR